MRVIAVFLIVLIAAIPAVSHFIVSFYYLPVLNAPHLRFQSLMPRILNDLKTVAERPPFPETEYRNDAEPLLAKYISWEGSGEVRPDADRVRELLTRFLYWKSAPGQLKQLMDDPDFKSIDTAWMQDLLKLDHWHLPSRPVLGEGLTAVAARDGFARVGAFASLPMPNFNELRLWATLHVIKQFKAGDARKALLVFRKAAQLAHSSGVLIGNMIAVVMLKDEHVLVEVLKIKNWETVPIEVVDAYQRVSWAWVAAKREAWFGEFPAAFRPYLRPQLGACTAAWDFAADAVGFQDFLEPRVPFETEFAANFTRARDLQNQLLAMCHLAEFRAAWGPARKESTQAEMSPGWAGLPFLRRILGLGLMGVAVPNYLEIYDKRISAVEAR